MENKNKVEELIDFITECGEYIYHYASSYSGKYTPVDYRNWHKKFLILVKTYDFNINKIKEDINNGKLIVGSPNLFDNMPKVKSLYDDLYKEHIKKVKEFENKYKI